MRFIHRCATFSLVALLSSGCASSADNAGSGTIQVTISGESLGLEGFAFPPRGSQEAYFVDGWEVRFESFIVSIDNIVVSEEPDKDSSNQTVTGVPVARVAGPFIVDLHQAGPLAGKGEGDKAWPLANISNQNLNAGKAFATDRKYAFGFETAPATPSAAKVGTFGATTKAAVETMVAKGYSVYVLGIATYRGTQCTPSARAPGLPAVVHFSFGFKTPTTYSNCDNPDLGSSDDNPVRGLAIKSNESTVAQITFHADHLFWDTIKEDASLRFDALALVAKAKAKGDLTNPLQFEDLEGIPYAPVNAGGETLPNRTCTPAAAPAKVGDVSYDPDGKPAIDLASFVATNQRTQGHMNADGLCASRAK